MGYGKWKSCNFAAINQKPINMRKLFLSIVLYVCAVISSQAADQFVLFAPQGDAFCLTGQKGAIVYDQNDWKGVHIAIANLKKDLEKVTGRQDYPIVIGTLGKSDVIDKMAKKKQINAKELQGKTEKFIITTVKDQLVIAGSDKRGTIYGIYELSQQIGVSPWYDWADVPAEKHEQLYIKKGIFTDGEPAVRYRGIFLNDEAPCLTSFMQGYSNWCFASRVITCGQPCGTPHSMPTTL